MNSPGLRVLAYHGAARFVEVRSGDGEISHLTADSLRPFHYGRTQQDQYRDADRDLSPPCVNQITTIRLEID
jgi:hypothetical protein